MVRTYIIYISIFFRLLVVMCITKTARCNLSKKYMYNMLFYYKYKDAVIYNTLVNLNYLNRTLIINLYIILTGFVHIYRKISKKFDVLYLIIR